MSRFPSSAGIAIGPILFVIALMGVLALVFASNSGSFGTATTADRVTADINSQANLIRSKIHECYMQSITTNQTITNNADNSTAPCAGSTDSCPDECEGDPYPCSDQTDGTLVKNLTCPNDPLTTDNIQQNIWTGPRNGLLPPPTSGFTEWRYMDAGAAGGRCFWTELAPSVTKNNGIVTGLMKVAAKFSTQEASYDQDSNTQKFVVFITLPSSPATLDDHCKVP
jgi:hypothetical protein